ncbi:MAG TPA: hypothetical protein VNN24_05105 [Candidatus Binatus sp.]|nr:hypothetical protein [Candidatus Binatus sp.]
MNKASFSKTIAKITLSIFAAAFPLYAQQNPEATARVAPGPNDTARFLAGMPVPPDSPLAPLTRDPAWQEHSAFFEKQFTKLNQRQLQKLHAWEETYLPETTQTIPVAFYMFSGPDFLYIDQFFPKASVYVLCGKESMGPPPDPLRVANLRGALQTLENAMSSALSYSFFITKDMKVDLELQELKGTLPILYVFIARADKSITNVTFGSLSGNGIFQEYARGKTGGGIPGVRINYTDNQSGNLQTLYYFTTDISDGGIKSNPGFLKFCQHFGVGSSLLKSSSYLLFESDFATIRNFILDHSRLIVQDDAGIPLDYFNRDKWNIRLFGNYIGPIEIFKQHYQAKLQELYQQSNPPPLEFNFGYRWNYKESNLIVAQRVER